MIFKNVNNLEIDSDIEGLDATIEQENLPVLFEIMSKSLYSNPIGSLIREITSNCFDSHIEANSNDAVVITKKYNIEDSNFSIIFEDFGVGLSPERITNIYMKYFSSTKRESNALIGGFGLGSKSPLSYQDHFYINTYFDGIEYNYVYTKGEKLPQIISLNGYDEISEEIAYTDDTTNEIKYKNIVKKIPIGLPTNKRNGTQIIVTIENGDQFKFKQELKQQLCYFDNVCFDNWDLPFDYNIYNYEFFKYRTIYQYSQVLHIVLGKVSYPINWSAIGIDQPIKIPIGIKFEIGELSITPNREEIRYVDGTKELILERIDKALNELNNLFNKNFKVVNNLYKYNELKKQKTVEINIGDEIIHIETEYFKNINYIYGYLNDEEKIVKYLDFVPKLKLFYELYEYNGLIGFNKIIKKYNLDLTDSLKDKNVFLIDKEYNIFNNRFLNESFNNPKSIKRKNIKNLSLLEWKELNECFDFYTFIKKSETEISFLNNRDEPENIIIKKNYYYDYHKKSNLRKVPELGKALIMYKAIKHFRSIIEKDCLKYSNYTPSKEWIDDYKLQNKKTSKKVTGSIHIKKIGYTKESINLETLTHYKHVIYALESEKKHYQIDHFKKILSHKKSYLEYSKNNRNIVTDKNFKNKYLFLFIELSKTNFDIIKTFPNLTHIDFVYYHKDFKKIPIELNTINILENSNMFDNKHLIKSFSNYYRKEIKVLEDYCKKYTTYLTINNSDKSFDSNIINKLKLLEKQLLNFYKVNYLKTDKIPDNELIFFIKQFKILKLDEKWYSNNKSLKEIQKEKELNLKNQLSLINQIQLF